MSRPSEAGFTLTELALVLLLMAAVIGLSSQWVILQFRQQKQLIHSDSRREAQARALSTTHAWMDRAARILPRAGALRSDAHTLLLEIPTDDAAGFRTVAHDVVALRWNDDDSFLVAVMSASGSANAPRDYSPASDIGETTFSYLDDRGNEAFWNLPQARSVCVRIAGGPTAVYSLGARP